VNLRKLQGQSFEFSENEFKEKLERISLQNGFREGKKLNWE
jgi:hypothetical protein